MLWLHYLKQIYSLDTLDTRFTSSSRTPPRQASAGIEADSVRDGQKPSQGARNPGDGTSPSRWKSPEFIFYYVFIFLFALPQMFKAAYDVSKESHPEYPKYSHLLEPGWIAGRKVDNSDSQYSNFRDNVPYLFLVLMIHPALRRLYDKLSPPGQAGDAKEDAARSSAESANPLRAADERQTQRVSFDIRFGLLFLVALHGFSALKILVILYINFILATRVPREYVPAATWAFNICILFANELGNGYQFAKAAELILPWTADATPEAKGSTSPRDWGAWLDSCGGLIPRWEILFNLTVLRLISFNLDYYWSQALRGASPIEKKQLDPANLSDRDRVSIPAKPDGYSFGNYLAYALYSPLYLAGPIVTFNDYMHQVRYPTPSITSSRTFLYAVRFLACLLCMELVLHFIYAVAISKAQPTWEIYTPFQLSMLGYFNLHIIWLKLLLPWRFFRLWALIDGIDPPENMVRCMSDNYSALAFWRGWHRSFNRWIVRYIYIPLGGSGARGSSGIAAKGRAALNFLAVFTFVALWHDINLRLLMWGWLVVLFILPEVVAGLLFPARRWENNKEAYRVLCGAGAVINILMMMAANLVGFAIGLDGLKGLVHGMVGSYAGVVFLVGACCSLFTGVQVMFEVREHENRQGIRLKC